MPETLNRSLSAQLPRLLETVVGGKRAHAVLAWLEATDHIRGRGTDGGSGRTSAERELVSRALEQWLAEAVEPVAEASHLAGASTTHHCRDCDAVIAEGWWDSRRCEPCWAVVKQATREANQQRRRSRRRLAESGQPATVSERQAA